MIEPERFLTAGVQSAVTQSLPFDSENTQGKKVCIIGGTGNIGTSITNVLLAQGCDVTNVVRGNTGTQSTDVRYIFCDRRDTERFESLMRLEQFDAAIDLTCFTLADAQSSLRAFRGVGHFIQTSTVMTYGVTPQWLPVTEDHPYQPHTQYGRDKVEADDFFLQANRNEGFPVTILKPSTSYGSQQGLFRQIGKDFAWLDRIKKGKPIIVCDSGIALHQFMHVDDVARAFAHTLENKKTIGQIYNVVSGVTTWAEFHRAAMLVINGKVGDLVSVPFDILNIYREQIPGFDICDEVFRHHSFYSGDKLRQALPQFQPTISLDQGIAMVLEDLQRTNRIPNSDSAEWQWEDSLITLSRPRNL